MELLGDASSERRDAGGMVLFGLAASAGGYHFVAASTSIGESEALSAVAYAGATETLRYAANFAPRPIGLSSSAGSVVEESAMTFNNNDGRGHGGSDGGGGEVRRDYGFGSWVLQTLAPLARYAADSANDESSGKLSPATLPGVAEALPAIPANEISVAARMASRRRKLSVGERKMSAAELHAHELSAALGLVEALVRATQDPVGGHTEHLEALMLEMPLIAGLLALAKTIPNSNEREVSAHASYNDSAAVGAALAIAKDVASICPKEIWLGLRAMVLPAIAAGSLSACGDRMGRGDSEVRSAQERSRASLVLREVVEGMGTGVVPFAARLLPVALKGMMDTDEKVKCSPLPRALPALGRGRALVPRIFKYFVVTPDEVSDRFESTVHTFIVYSRLLKIDQGSLSACWIDSQWCYRWVLPTLAKVRGILAATFNRLVKAVALAADGEEDDKNIASKWTSRSPAAGEEITVVERDGEVEFGAKESGSDFVLLS